MELFHTHRDLMPSLGVILSHFPDDLIMPKTRMVEVCDGENCVISAGFI